MEWFVAAVAVAGLGVAAVAAAGGMGGMSRDPVRDVYRQDLPSSPLGAEDLARVLFGIALRGYAMGQVDDLLDRLGREIAERDATIARLGANRAAQQPGMLPPGAPDGVPPQAPGQAAETSRG